MAVSLDASLRTDRWEELLDKLVDYLELISGVIIVSDPRHERRVTPFQSRFIREDARDMLQRFLAREDADDAPAYRAIQNLPLNRLYAEPEIFGCEGWENLPASAVDRKSVVEGKSVSVRVDLGGRRISKKKNKDK